MNETNRGEWTEGGVVSDGLLGDSRLLKRSHQHLLLLLAFSTFPPLGSVGRAGTSPARSVKRVFDPIGSSLQAEGRNKDDGTDGSVPCYLLKSTSALQQQHHAVQQKSMFGLNRHPNHSRIKRR